MSRPSLPGIGAWMLSAAYLHIESHQQSTCAALMVPIQDLFMGIVLVECRTLARDILYRKAPGDHQDSVRLLPDQVVWSRNTVVPRFSSRLSPSSVDINLPSLRLHHR